MNDLIRSGYNVLDKLQECILKSEEKILILKDDQKRREGEYQEKLLFKHTPSQKDSSVLLSVRIKL